MTHSHEVYDGRAVYIYAYDIAYEINLEQVGFLLSKPLQEYAIGPSKRSPKYYFFYRPKICRLSDEKCLLHGRSVVLHWDVKVFSIGAVSIEVSLPFAGVSLHELVGYHDPVFDDNMSLEMKVRKQVELMLAELRPMCVNPVDAIGQSEAYTVFCLNRLSDNRKAEGWLKENKRAVAALLVEEDDPELLSEQEASETISRYASYYEKDMVVVDWDAALVIDEGESLEDILHIMELANVQLAELAAYDRILDESLQNAYRDLSRRQGRVGGKRILGRLREIRVDMTRITDELTNITKFFGDWYLAKVYEHLFDRFHLSQWHHVVSEKLRVLGDFYGLLQQERNNLWMMILEATIVLLFILDLLLLLWGH
jgi:tRNA isopentenyl-2-thiomethyl-A-37 hydroxylase MiaE